MMGEDFCCDTCMSMPTTFWPVAIRISLLSSVWSFYKMVSTILQQQGEPSPLPPIFHANLWLHDPPCRKINLTGNWHTPYLWTVFVIHDVLCAVWCGGVFPCQRLICWVSNSNAALHVKCPCVARVLFNYTVYIAQCCMLLHNTVAWDVCACSLFRLLPNCITG